MRLIDADKFKQQLCAMVVKDNLNVDKANNFCKIIDMQPTIPIPEKMEVCGTYSKEDVPASYKVGWNACVDEILKDGGEKMCSGMAENEAIKEFKENIEMPFGSSISNEASEIAINTINKLEQYRSIGSVEECREAMERQRRKKPIKDEFNHDCCPDCGWIVYQEEWGGRYLPHCENCGQAIDWSKPMYANEKIKKWIEEHRGREDSKR